MMPCALSSPLIDSRQAFERFLHRLENIELLAIDVEADSLYHYRPKICLIQMATPNDIVLVDPLRLTDISALKPILEDPNVLKILHGADYDIRSLNRDFGFNVHPIFDTELASRFLGVRHTGLDAVLASRFGIDVDKRFQKKDWSKRPLSDEMIHYAAQDVRFLIPLYRVLLAELEEKGRIDWVKEECERLSDVRYKAGVESQRFLRVKGAGKLKPRSLSVLEELLALRDREAERLDRPPFKVFDHQSLLTIATALPRTIEELEALHVLSPKQIAGFGAAIVDIVLEQLQKPAEELLHFPKNGSPVNDPNCNARLALLKKMRTCTAEELDMDPGQVCNNALLGRIAAQTSLSLETLARLEEMKAWQLAVLGPRILDALSQAPGVRIEK
ncbi:MAG: ribonuclease D [Thermodesulfobacteriota bacterium]